MSRSHRAAMALGLACVSHVASAAPVSVDGAIGSEWSAVTPAHVLYNPAAPLGNFGAPTNENASGEYDVYLRGDGSYVYVGVQTTGTNDGGLNFANLYFGTPALGSTIGFETGNFNAFKPGAPGSATYTTAGSDIHFAKTDYSVSTPGVVEFAVPYAFFGSDSLGLGVTPLTSVVQLRLSQSFGYSVAGGATYGADRLGVVAVPEPASLSLAGVGAIGLLRRSRRAK